MSGARVHRVPAKWVLAGEHSVLRGGMAIALPHPELSLTLRVEDADAFSVAPSQARATIEALWARARGPGTPLPRAQYRFESSIPERSGLGSSSALCVALALEWAQGADPFAFARGLENHFHGESSGMDVAVALAGRPIRFTRAGGAHPLPIEHLPCFRFHDTGLRGDTRECIARVKALAEKDPERARWIDLRMQGAAEDCERYLLRYDELVRAGASREERNSLLERMCKPIRNAQDCIRDWGLQPQESAELESQLLAEGALVVKQTGAGLGGFLVSLWREGAEDAEGEGLPSCSASSKITSP